MRVRSQWPLPYRAPAGEGLGEIGLLRGSTVRFTSAVDAARATGRDERTWLRGIDLEDGQTYLRWTNRFEFLVSPDGRSIEARPLNGESVEAFHTYLLGPALSFALLKQGFDPLHATTVAIDGAAVGFLGDAGYGKSSLAAAFLRIGHRLLTDDLLVLSPCRDGFIAHPGPPRIKLSPKIARGVLGPAARGVRMTAAAPKLVIPLGERQAANSAVPLRALYVIAPPERGQSRSGVTIRRVSKRHACLALLRNAFNTAVGNRQRLSRQFAFAVSVAASVPIKRIAYPRAIAQLARAREAILEDLARG
ncbi:MAG TPA: hypothetical protein VKH42_03690 [Vicinamibacterales bacterium]|nr:hypothetical protein [Vicinamibacterales bacterium]